MAQALGEDLVQPCELQDDSSSLGSDSELSGPGPYRQADRYGFIGGSSAEPGPGHPPADLIRQREMKWVEMTSHWEKTMSRRYKKVKMQCRKGIPSALRARCWPLLCGAHVCQKNSPGTYQELAEAPGDPQWMETIGRDLHRQFPLHEMFVSPQGHGQQGLLQVLKAYTLYRPEQGYCQAQGPVAAVLLMHLPPEEAFWCLVQICEVYLPGYYGPHMVRGWDAARGYRGRGWAGGWRPGDPGDRGWALGVEVLMGVAAGGRAAGRRGVHGPAAAAAPARAQAPAAGGRRAPALPARVVPVPLRPLPALPHSAACLGRLPQRGCEGAVPCGADAGAPGAGHCRTAPGLPGAPGDTRCPANHPPSPAAGGGLHVPGAQRGPVRARPAAADQSPARPAARVGVRATPTATGPPARGSSHL
uniref:TBC1 domain family member 10C n=1 Tax=Equus asinus TaxID=9793 RepID=A0A9L0IMS5_EQUAS